MSLRCPETCFVLCALLALASCRREERRFEEASSGAKPPRAVSVSQLHPGGSPPLAANQTAPYDDNAFAVSEGKRLYQWFNCVGCHSQGGGGMGPALMDDRWIYGSEPQNIFATIVEGRPNGMPSFGGRIPTQQVWQLVSYVRSLSGQLRKDVAPGRSDHMMVRPTEQSTTRAVPRPVTPPPPGG
jgi:cytochrome c oxidase cbb3-type subunit 3